MADRRVKLVKTTMTEAERRRRLSAAYAVLLAAKTTADADDRDGETAPAAGDADPQTGDRQEFTP